MKHIKGYNRYHNNKYSDYNRTRSDFNRIIENNYQEFISKSKSNHYHDMGVSDTRNIFEIALSPIEYQFLKENMRIDDINDILVESISMTIKMSNDDVINEGIIDGIKKKIGDSYDKAVTWVDAKIDKAVEFGKVAVKKMKDIITNITEIVTSLYTQTKSSLVQMWGFLGTQMSKLTQKIKTGMTHVGDARSKAFVSILESDNMEKESEEAKKDFVKIKQMVTGGKLADQSSVESTLKGKAEEFKNFKADELEKTVLDDVTTSQTESIITILKGLILERGIGILDGVTESLKLESFDRINEKGDVSAKSIFSWVLEGVSVIISWKSKLIEKITKIGTNFMMNFMSNVARAGQGVKYILMGQIVSLVIALVYEMTHLVSQVGGVHESKLNEADEVPNTDEKTEPAQVEEKPDPNDKTDVETTVDPNKVKESIKNINMDSIAPDKIITAIDWKALKFAGLSIVFTLAIKTLLPQLSLLFTIIGVCVCSFELIDSLCSMSKSHKGICKNVHGVEHFANSLFAKKPAVA